MEVALSSKRKLGFVLGTVVKSTTDANKGEQWETCNSMVISWLFSSLSDQVKKSVLYLTSAKDIWAHLEQRFSLSNGSRKYKINRDLYALKQQGSINDYYTSMRSLWEELDSMNVLPAITSMTDDVKILLETITRYQDESKLFQFLNGLHESFGPQRSNLLMLTPLPSVETACAVLQQEESQREILTIPRIDHDVSAMFSRNNNHNPDKNMVCSVCGLKGHTNTRCWHVIGFPKSHPKHKPFQNFKPQIKQPETPRWNQNRPSYPPKIAAARSHPFTSFPFFPWQYHILTTTI